MSEDTTTLYAGIVIALIVGAAVGYFVYPTMNPANTDTVEDDRPTQSSRDHNHAGIWLLLVLTCLIVLGEGKKS